MQFDKEEEALKAFRAMQGRFYGGKQIHMEFCPVKRWNTAICGQYEKTRYCPKGRNCNFLHVFRNPGDRYATFLGRDERGAAIPPSSIDDEPFFVIDNEGNRGDERSRRDHDERRYREDRGGRDDRSSRDRYNRDRSRSRSRSRSRERNRHRQSRSRSRERRYHHDRGGREDYRSSNRHERYNNYRERSSSRERRRR